MGIIRKIRSNKLYKNNKEHFEEILIKYSAYFRDLDSLNRDLFLKRLSEFIVATKFSSEKGLLVTQEMKVLISSAFIMITFGLRNYTLKAYSNVFIAPRSYKYKAHGQLFSGDVNTQLKRISLSWPAVVKGFELPNDSLNIAIHEFGHCLVIENFHKAYFNTFFSNEEWKLWSIEAVKKLTIIRNGGHSIIRNYGGTDLMELFAVSLETFFENPQQFDSEVPQLFNSMKNLLKQDPRNKQNPLRY